jgi:O-antigen/teichoic acid export membrane protein
LLKNKLFVKFFSSGLQVIAVQVLGSIFFYFISVYLSKENFGIINWMNAVSLFITVLLGFGLEQVVVRRISSSSRSDWAAGAFFAHAVAGVILTFLFLVLLNLIINDSAGIYRFLPWFFAAQGLIYMGVPFKQFLNAKENFAPYGIIAVVSNIGKILAAYLLLQKHKLYIDTVSIILIVTAGFELCSLLIYITTRTTFSFKLHIKAYIKLIKESSAQYISVIFDMSLSRMDWILLGIMTTPVVLADYSFAYRAFELARLPMLVVAPIILPAMARLMASNNKPGIIHQRHINSFNTIEIFFAVLISLSLNILWVPLVTLITNGKYGFTNSLQFLLLSLCIPLQFFVNLLWSISFGAKKYKQVLIISIICATANILLNILLISKFKGTGAAAAFFISTLLQSYLYYKLVSKQFMRVSLRPLVVLVTSATIIYFIVVRLNVHFIIQFLIGLILYSLISVLSGQISRQRIRDFKQFLSR